jgi:uncharacterized protein YbcI
MSDVPGEQQQAAPAPGSEERGRVLLDLSNAVVRIHKQYYGKGPTKARSHITGDLAVVILEGGFTRSEATLLDHGHQDEVISSRAAMQDSVETELRMTVEQIVGRSVRSFMSANDPERGFQAEIFVLDAREPNEDDEVLTERARRAREEHREILDEHRALRAEQAQNRRNLESRRHFEP